MEVELEVSGRHAMLFDDDATLEFVNSKEALIEWNSLFIDRFDVRNLITAPPASFRHLPASFHSGSGLPADDSHLHPDLDSERFADLAYAYDDDDLPIEAEVEVKDAGGYRCVPFSYGKSADCTEQKDSDMGLKASAFHPSFPVPENLLQNLPPTDKVHQIIARTAMFVGEHGGQSEIVLRVKQGDNPTFGFLMPHHHLHPYFRYLVDHPEILKSDKDSKSHDGNANGIQASGALSLLGSVYGSGEDEDVATEVGRESEQMDSGGASAVDVLKSNQSEHDQSGSGIQNEETVSVLPHNSKVKITAPCKYSTNSMKPGQATSMKSDGKVSSLVGAVTEKPKASSLFPLPQAETSLLVPPSEMKRLVDRIVEIVLKNGKDFEAILIEQDKKRGKFPFLLPSNQYNPYYLKLLKKAQESRISGKTFCSEKDGSSWQEMEKNPAREGKGNEFASSDALDDLQLDYDKKEKFKMVIAKPKKDSQDQPSKESQQQCGFTVDTAAAAAIVQAATRGIRNPNLDIFSKTSHGSSKGSGLGSGPTGLLTAQQSLPLKENEESSDTVSGEKPTAKLSAHATTSQADSTEAGLTRQQKLKAERLRKAKMFAAMLKSGAAPLGTEPVRASSLEQPVSGNSASVAENVNEEVRVREGSSAPVEAGTSKDEVEKSVLDLSNDEKEQKLSKRRHYRSRKHDDGEGEEGKEGNGEGSEEEEDEEDQRRSRKRHKLRHSTSYHRDRSKDRHKHRRKHSSSKSKETRHRHKHDNSSSLEDDDDRRHRQKHNSSSEDERKHRKRSHRHVRSSKEDNEHHKRRDSSSDEESKHHKRRHKQSHRKDRHRERSSKNDKSHGEEGELEDGEIRTKSSDQSLSAVGGDGSREGSVNASKSPLQEKRPSLPPAETTEVPDELRAKIRAMLLATM